MDFLVSKSGVKKKSCIDPLKSVKWIKCPYFMMGDDVVYHGNKPIDMAGRFSVQVVTMSSIQCLCQQHIQRRINCNGGIFG